jgi:Formate hydrogenlyase subunit 3/Multisubunit Na+/H+ antiporter, MnhD subunit
MNSFSADHLLYGSITVYLAAAVAAIVFYKRHSLCTLFAQSGCILASMLSAALSLTILLSKGVTLKPVPFKSSIPFLSISLRIDALSAFFILALSILVFCVSIYSISYVTHYHGKRNVSAFHILYIAFIFSMFFVFTAGNAVFFFMAWELMAVISYFLVVFESEQEGNDRAGLIYIVMTHIGTAFLMIGFMIMFSYTKSFDLFGSSDAIPARAKNLMFILFLLGFGVKAGIVPVHIWLPYAHPAAPSNVSALMSGIMIKTAIYGLIRFVLCYLHIQHTWWGVLILCLGAVSAVLGVAYALMEHNIKRLLAFHSVENIGIILIGLGISFTAFARGDELLGSIALAASLFHTFNHTLFKGGLFLGAGSIQYASHTKDIEKLGGLIKKMPVTAVMVLCFSLAISAIVPFNGFVSEWLTYQSLFSAIIPGQTGLNIVAILTIAALAMSGALAAACFVKLFGISFLGKPRSEHSVSAVEVPAPMNTGMGILAVFCLLLGLFPMLFLKAVNNVVLAISGTAISDKLQGGVLIAYYPVNASGNAITPIEIFAALAIIIVASAAVIRLVGGKTKQRIYGTWDCGFGELTPRMQYTATGFTKPLRIVFRVLYRPGRSLETVEGDSSYFPASRKYSVWTEPIFEKYIYNPLVNAVKKFSLRINLTVQTGSTHAYLVYIFIAILALMLYNRLA